MSRDAIGERGSDAVADFHDVTMDRDVAVGIDLHRPERAVRARTVILGGASYAGTDRNSAFGAGFLVGPLPPDRMAFQVVQDLRRADRDRIGIPRHRAAARLQRVAPPE